MPLIPFFWFFFIYKIFYRLKLCMIVYCSTGDFYIMTLYAGPNSQQVSDRFKLDWGTYLTTSEDIIYAVIDGRGSGFRGDDLLYEIHRKLGQPEVQDQIDVAKKLVNLYSFIDKSRVAIWGWSYGGELKEVYKTALCK